MDDFIKMIKKKMIDADLYNYKDLAWAIGMKYDTFLVRLKDPGSFRVYEIKSLEEVLDLSDEDVLKLLRE